MLPHFVSPLFLAGLLATTSTAPALAKKPSPDVPMRLAEFIAQQGLSLRQEGPSAGGSRSAVLSTSPCGENLAAKTRVDVEIYEEQPVSCCFGWLTGKVGLTLEGRATVHWTYNGSEVQVVWFSRERNLVRITVPDPKPDEAVAVDLAGLRWIPSYEGAAANYLPTVKTEEDLKVKLNQRFNGDVLRQARNEEFPSVKAVAEKDAVERVRQMLAPFFPGIAVEIAR
jgi:hypothetical protein